jgi:SRSO17 transposase
MSAKQLVRALSTKAWKTITGREDTRVSLRSRFAAVRIRAAHRDCKRSFPHPEEWLLIKRPRGEA